MNKGSPYLISNIILKIFLSELWAGVLLPFFIQIFLEKCSGYIDITVVRTFLCTAATIHLHLCSYGLTTLNIPYQTVILENLKMGY